ncbi:hypothetical protein GGR57DRAFT_186072 [Xylariaceae sp. FL1272]|nr:hypothetical protein GGR57DRAFT_186072 [Xylariaceae sp. FL1272]
MHATYAHIVYYGTQGKRQPPCNYKGPTMARAVRIRRDWLVELQLQLRDCLGFGQNQRHQTRPSSPPPLPPPQQTTQHTTIPRPSQYHSLPPSFRAHATSFAHCLISSADSISIATETHRNPASVSCAVAQTHEHRTSRMPARPPRRITKNQTKLEFKADMLSLISQRLYVLVHGTNRQLYTPSLPLRSLQASNHQGTGF